MVVWSRNDSGKPKSTWPITNHKQYQIRSPTVQSKSTRNFSVSLRSGIKLSPLWGLCYLLSFQAWWMSGLKPPLRVWMLSCWMRRQWNTLKQWTSWRKVCHQTVSFPSWRIAWKDSEIRYVPTEHAMICRSVARRVLKLKGKDNNFDKHIFCLSRQIFHAIIMI